MLELFLDATDTPRSALICHCIWHSENTKRALVEAILDPTIVTLARHKVHPLEADDGLGQDQDDGQAPRVYVLDENEDGLVTPLEEQSEEFTEYIEFKGYQCEELLRCLGISILDWICKDLEIDTQMVPALTYERLSRNPEDDFLKSVV